MKKLLSSVAALSLLSGAASAGTLTDPAVEEEVMMAEEPAASSSGFIVPLLLLLAVGAAVASSGDDEDEGSILVSDQRLKRDIERIGTTEHGLGLYSYRYIWSKKRHEGVMAQEVAQKMPAAVVKGMFGLLRVNYSKLGLKAT